MMRIAPLLMTIGGLLHGPAVADIGEARLHVGFDPGAFLQRAIAFERDHHRARAAA